MITIKIKSEYQDLDKYEYINKDIHYFKKDIHYFKKDTRVRHNPYGPAVINKYGYKEYWIENKVHRLDGPAIIYYNSEEKYFINGQFLTKKEFELHPERLKFLGKEHLICLK